MRLSRVRIQNFRAFEDETIHFDDLTAFVGSNGVGKSSILSALNVFFRESRNTALDVTQLTDEDAHHKNTDLPITIAVTFTGLSAAEAEDFKEYYRQGE